MLQKVSILVLIVSLMAIFPYCSQKRDSPEIKFDLLGESKLTFINLSNSPVQIKFEKWSSIPVDFVDINAVVDQGESYSVNLKNPQHGLYLFGLKQSRPQCFYATRFG
jgi:hypothetical protein